MGTLRSDRNRVSGDGTGMTVSCRQKQTCFSKPTKRKRLHAIARTFGLLGAHG